MSIIAVKGIPLAWNLKFCTKKLKIIVKGPCDALNFQSGVQLNNRNQPTKTLYLRVSERLDPQYAIELINRGHMTGVKLIAYIPDHVPDLPLPSNKAQKLQTKQFLKAKQQLKVKTPTPAEILVVTHAELLAELQYKYTGLNQLDVSEKMLDEIAKILYDRLKVLLEADLKQQGFVLSMNYRKKYPHTGDYAMIISTLHKVQDAMGVPRTPKEEVSEQNLTAVCTQPNIIGNIPLAKVQRACDKYSDRILKKVTEHIKNLDDKIETGKDNEEEIARKKVRAELKKIQPYLSTIISQVIKDNCSVPEKSPYQRFRIYAEPFLPPRDIIQSFLTKYRTVKMHRGDRLYNYLKFYIPLNQYPSLMAMDGTILGGAKLVIRPSEKTLYKIPESLLSEMKAFEGQSVTPDQTEPEDQEYEEMDIPAGEDWSEPWE